MAAHSLAIAKASLAAGLMRPAPESVSKVEIAHFHRLLDALMRQCSSTHIQQCKEWLLGNVAQSPAKMSAVGKYVVSLSASWAGQGESAPPAHEQPQPSSMRCRQLYILYLLHDLLHHARFHSQGDEHYASLSENIQPHLVHLVAMALDHNPTKYSKHYGKVVQMIDIWANASYFSAPFISSLRDLVSCGSQSKTHSTERSGKFSGGNENTSSENAATRKDSPYILPPNHGEASTPFFDLPAGNLMPHIVTGSQSPINPQLVKPLQMPSGPADDNLVAAVKGFLRDVERIYDPSSGMRKASELDIDELGQMFDHDDAAAESSLGSGYYGWSKAFCEKMKQRHAARNSAGFEHIHGHDSTFSIHKRRNRSYSDSSRSRSASPSANSSRPDFIRGSRVARWSDRSRKQSSSRSRSRSGNDDSIRNRIGRSRTRSKSAVRSRSRSYSPLDNLIGQQNSTRSDRKIHGEKPQSGDPFIPFAQPGYLGLHPLPVPPPPPNSYSGPWSLQPLPPPPPPPPPPLAAVPLSDVSRQNPPFVMQQSHGPPPAVPPYYKPNSTSIEAPYGQASKQLNNWSQYQSGAYAASDAVAHQGTAFGRRD